MLFDIRKMHLKSLGDFAREYIMIVVGILTALGLEHVVTSREHAKGAAESRERIVAELRGNLADLRTSREENLRQLKPLVALADEVKRRLRAGEPGEKTAQFIEEKSGGLQVAYTVPGFRHEAWDVAVANQSASYIDPAALRRYSAAYAAERDAVGVALAPAANLLNGPRTLDALLDVELRHTNPLEFLKVLGHLTAALNGAVANLAQTQKEIESALAGEANASPEPTK